MKRLGGQVIIIFSEQVFCTGAALVVSVLMARGLGAEGLGAWKLLMSTQTIAGYLLGMGLTVTMSRFLAQLIRDSQEGCIYTLVFSLFVVRLGVLATVGCIYIIMVKAGFFLYFPVTWGGALVVFMYMLNDLIGKPVFAGILKRYIASIVLIVTRTCFALVISGLALSNKLVFGTALETLLYVYILEFILFLFLFYRFSSLYGWSSISKSFWARIRGFSLNQYAFQVFQVLRENAVDSFMILWIKGVEAVGLFGAGITLPNLIRVFSPGKVFSSMIFPILVVGDDEIKYHKYFSFVQKITAVVVWPLLVFVFVWADVILVVVLGHDFVSASAVLRVAILFVAVSAACDPFFTIGIALERNRLLLEVSIWGMVNLLLNLILIPFFGGVGAALSTGIVAIGVYVHFYWALARGGWSFIFPLAAASKVLLAVIVLGFLSWSFRGTDPDILNCIKSLALSVPIYLLYVYIIRIFNDSEMDVLRSLVGGRLPMGAKKE